jgi:hypothetical protein
MLMENIDLATLIVAGLCGIGIIEVILWVIAMIKHRGDDVLELNLLQTASIRASIAEGSERSHFSDPEK